MLKTSCPKREMENMRGGKGLLHATDLTTVEECYGCLLYTSPEPGHRLYQL